MEFLQETSFKSCFVGRGDRQSRSYSCLDRFGLVAPPQAKAQIGAFAWPQRPPLSSP